jgi:Protein of unknown function (DUF402)
MTFERGQTVLHRSWRGGRISFMQVTTAVADDERGTFFWLPIGAPFYRIVAADGRTHHDSPIDELGPDARLEERTWEGSHALIWKSRGDAVSVWWFFSPELDFREWYVNLEDPAGRWTDGTAAGVDYADHALDIRVAPDGTWAWKDMGEFEARTGHPLYWDAVQAAEIRAEGERVVKLIDVQAFPFDGTWCDFQPDLAWPVPVRPAGWDRPRAY